MADEQQLEDYLKDWACDVKTSDEARSVLYAVRSEGNDVENNKSEEWLQILTRNVETPDMANVLLNAIHYKETGDRAFREKAEKTITAISSRENALNIEALNALNISTSCVDKLAFLIIAERTITSIDAYLESKSTNKQLLINERKCKSYFEHLQQRYPQGKVQP